ncbi:pyridoxamine 5'-phosphate oxidase family protein [Nocardioides sp. GCM10027113]|uniref:pyridoxamine 5'-phosphate oxidase family protein n=1 Tax=unclassified Nocardioides TaxID=2615069 RepID=UPI00361282CE
MSIPVPIDRLAETLQDFGPGYLLTAGADGRVKVVTVEPTPVDGALACGASRGSAANATANPAATLLFPPPEPRGFSLIVDGDASVASGDEVSVRPTKAVLHRPASHADGPVAGDGCGHDCKPVE